jgi:hypothetical protein
MNAALVRSLGEAHSRPCLWAVLWLHGSMVDPVPLAHYSSSKRRVSVRPSWPMVVAGKMAVALPR